MGDRKSTSRKRGRGDQDIGFTAKKIATVDKEGPGGAVAENTPVSDFVKDQLGNRYGNHHASPFEVTLIKLESSLNKFNRGKFSMGRALTRFGNLMSNSYSLRYSGRDKFKINFSVFGDANNFVDAFNKEGDTLFENEIWRAFIPNFRVIKTVVLRGFGDEELTTDEICDNIRPHPKYAQNFCKPFKVEQMKSWRENDAGKMELVPVRAFKGFFKCAVVPEVMMVYTAEVKAVPFIDRVKRCSVCLRYGHLARFCKDTHVYCGFCAERGHDEKCCRVKKDDPGAAKCINCCREERPDVKHSALSKNCPVFLLQKRIKVVMAFHNKNPREALEMLEKSGGRIPNRPSTYSDSLKVDMSKIFENVQKIRTKNFARNKHRLRKTKKQVENREFEPMSDSESVYPSESENEARMSTAAPASADPACSQAYRDEMFDELVSSSFDATIHACDVSPQESIDRESLLAKLRQKIAELRQSNPDANVIAYKSFIETVNLLEAQSSSEEYLLQTWNKVVAHLNKHQNMPKWFKVFRVTNN